MGDPNKPGAISVTLKHDGKDGTWIVFHGSPAEVRSQIIEVMEMEDNGAPLYDLVNEATRIYKATGNVSKGLGGRTINGKNQNADSTSSGSAWDRAAGSTGEGAAEEPQEDPNVTRLLAAIEAAESRQALKELYARDKATFDANDDLMQEWKSKGKSLPA